MPSGFPTGNMLGAPPLPQVPSIGNGAAPAAVPGATNANPDILTGNNAAIPQIERLFTARPRSIINVIGSYTTEDSWNGNTYERGTRAYIRILSPISDGLNQRVAAYNRANTTNYLNSNRNPVDEAYTGSYQPGQNGYADFFLTGISSSMSEKTQVTQVFGDTEVVYYFGKNPVSFEFSGMLIDSPDNNWFVQWMEMYDTFLRGTQLARNYELCKIILPNMEVVGSVTAMSWQQSSMNDVQIPFSFSFLAKSVSPTGALLTQGVYSDEVAALNFNVDGVPTLTQTSINALKVAADASAAAAPLSGLIGSLDSASAWVTHIGNVGASNPVYSFLTGIRTSMFSPVMGVLSSLTKLISSVSGSLNKVLGSFTNPLKGILRDISSISNMATGLIGALNNIPLSLAGQINSTRNQLASTLATLQNTKGAFGSSHSTLGDSMKVLLNSGQLAPSSPIFTSTPSAALLPSAPAGPSSVVGLPSGPSLTFAGIPVTKVGSSALSNPGASIPKLPGTGSRLSKMDLLSSAPSPTASAGAYL
jgi:hypothetical protein